jgi:hypothetical protein
MRLALISDSDIRPIIYENTQIKDKIDLFDDIDESIFEYEVILLNKNIALKGLAFLTRFTF